MKRQQIFMLLFLALLLISGCSDSDDTGSEQVPIELHATGDGKVETKADQTITQAFGTTVFASMREKDYTGLTQPANAKEWKKDTEVQTNGSVSLPGNPTYPENGDWLYLVAVAPKISSYDDGTGEATYALTGRTDLMYARQIRGNRWDGSRFSNTDGSVTPLVYTHLLTQLTFKAKKENLDGLTIKVKKISVTTTNSVTLALTDGKTSFSGSGELSVTFPEEGIDVSGTEVIELTGALLLPPLASASDSYQLTVETSVGTFSGLTIEAQSPGGTLSFGEGVSHEITLNISDKELGISSVDVSEWVPVVNNDDLVLID